MSRKFSYAMGLAWGGLVLAVGFVWFTLSNAKPNMVQMGDSKLERTLISSSNVPKERMQNQLEQLRQQYSAEQKAVRKQMESLKQALGSHIALTEHASIADDTDPAWEVIDEQERRELIAGEERAQQDELVSHLEAEDVDERWSSWAKAEIGTAFDMVEDTNIGIYDIECRSTFCRVEVAFDDVKTIDQAVAHLMTFVPWPAQAFYHRDDEEGATGSLYIYREQEEEDGTNSQLY